jgi:hypothetical protein
VDAENSKGGKIKIDPISKEKIVGVSFEGGDTHFLVGDSKTPQKVAFKNVIRIETDSGSSKGKAASSESVSVVGKDAAGNSDMLPVGLQEKLLYLMSVLQSTEAKPTAAQVQAVLKLTANALELKNRSTTISK